MEGILIDGRLLKLLMLANQKEYNTLEDFAETIGVSTRTIRTYIEQLNYTLTNQLAQLVYTKGKGYKLQVCNQEHLQELINNSLYKESNVLFLNDPEERMKYVMKRLINSDIPITIDDLAQEINVGRTTLNNDLKKLASKLILYNMKIIGKRNGGIELKGSEIDQRLYFLDEFCKGLNGEFNKELLLKNIDEDTFREVKNDLKNYFYSIDYDISDETIVGIMAYITMLFTRIKENKHIVEMDKKYDEIFLTYEFEIMNNLKETLEKKLDIEISNKEMVFLTLPLLVTKAPVNSNLNEITISSNIKELVIKILDQVFENTGIFIKYDEELILGLEYHLNFALNRLMFNVKLNNPLLHEIKKHYPLAFNMAKVASTVIEKMLNVHVSEDEVAYLALHFGSYIERSNHKYFNINTVALVCGTGLGTARLLHVKLKKLLGEDKEIQTFADRELTKELLDSYDLVFTTINIKVETTTPIIKVSAIFNEGEIEKEIEKRYYYKEVALEQEETSFPLKYINIQEDMFFVLEEDTYINHLKYMSSRLYDNGVVDEGFTKRILEREDKSPTSFDNYIAFPHTVNEKTNNVSVSIGILKKPVVWGGNEVKIIILMMIPKEEFDTTLLIKTYEELLTLCQNKKFIESASKVRNYNEFRKLIKKEVIL
ncbi:MAG: transcription antiterminator [Clostridiaceae bacterium]